MIRNKTFFSYFIIVSIIFLNILFFTVQTFAQENEESIFDESTFDETVKDVSSTAAKVEMSVGGNAQFDISYSMDLDDGNSWGFFMDLSGLVYAKVSYNPYGSVYASWSYNFPIAQYFGSTYSFLKIPGFTPPESEVTATLREIFFDIMIENSVFIRTGKQVIHWGPAFFWTPVDFINLEKFNPLSTSDVRSGKSGMRIHIPVKKMNFYMFIDMNDALTLGSAQRFPDSAKLAFRYDITIEDIEFALTTLVDKDKALFGFDFSGYIFGLSMYGEFAYAEKGYTLKVLDSSGLNPIVGYTNNAVYSFTIGVQKSFGDNKYWTVSADFYFNSDGYDTTTVYRGIYQQLAWGNLEYTPYYVPLYMSKWYAHLGIAKQKLFGDYIGGNLDGVLNITDLSYILSLGFNFKFPSLIPFTVKVDYKGGEELREFTALGTNYFSFMFTMQIEF